MKYVEAVVFIDPLEGNDLLLFYHGIEGTLRFFNSASRLNSPTAARSPQAPFGKP